MLMCLVYRSLVNNSPAVPALRRDFPCLSEMQAASFEGAGSAQLLLFRSSEAGSISIERALIQEIVKGKPENNSIRQMDLGSIFLS